VRQRKAAALAQLDAELAQKRARARDLDLKNTDTARLNEDMLRQIQSSVELAKNAAEAKLNAVRQTRSAHEEAARARATLEDLRAQLARSQKALFESRVAATFGPGVVGITPATTVWRAGAEPPKKRKKPEPRYGMYLREGEESGSEDSSLAFWRRVHARKVGKGKFEPYYYRIERRAKRAKAAKLAKAKKSKSKHKPKRYIRPEYEVPPPKPKKCKHGKAKCKKIKPRKDLSVLPEYENDLGPLVEYITLAPSDRLIRVRTTARTRPRFLQLADEAEDEAEDEEEDADEQEEEEEAADAEEAESEAAVDESEDEEADESAAAASVPVPAMPRFAEVDTATETEAESVLDLKAAKWAANAVEAEVVSESERVAAKSAHARHKKKLKKMKPVCYKGDAKCLKTAQEAEQNARKKRLAKFKHKPVIVDPLAVARKKLAEALRKVRAAAKRPEFDFTTPQYQTADFVNPEYRGPEHTQPPTGLPLGWTVPMTKPRV